MSEQASRSAVATTDHEEIRRWVDEKGGHPACVKGTGAKSDPGVLRIDFPGFSGEESLEPISWEEWFRQFDENGLALLIGSEKGSRFNKLVRRDENSHKRAA